MAIVNFPANPSIGDQYNENGITYTWNGAAWTANGAENTDARYVQVTGDTMTGNLNVPSINGGPLGSRNLIINGDFLIDQRNQGAIVTPTADGEYTVDRWMIRQSSNSVMTVQKNSGNLTPPAGFHSYIGITSLVNSSLAAGSYFGLTQRIEANNIKNLGFGSSAAKAVTLSFYVRSNLTGTFSGALTNGAHTRSYPFTYTISAADTWEYKTVLIPGDVGGLWDTGNISGMQLNLDLGTGSNYVGTAETWADSTLLGADNTNNLLETTGNTFYLTGVQLESGESATPFQYEDYATTLHKCQRYYHKIAEGNNQSIAIGTFYNTTQVYATYTYPTTMRAAPTIDTVFSNNYFIVYTNSTNYGASSIAIDGAATEDACEFVFNLNGSSTAGHSGMVRSYNPSAYLAVDAEL